MMMCLYVVADTDRPDDIDGGVFFRDRVQAIAHARNHHMAVFVLRVQREGHETQLMEDADYRGR